MYGSSFDDARFVWSQGLAMRAKGLVELLIQQPLT